MRLCERLDVGERAVAEQRALADIVCCVESRTRKLLLSCSRDRSSGRAPGAAASFEPATPSPGHLVPRGVCRPVHHHPSSDSSMPRRRESAAAAAAAAAGTQPTQQQRARPFSAVHRLAFVQELMRKGVVLEAHALDTFEQLTGSSSGARWGTARRACVRVFDSAKASCSHARPHVGACHVRSGRAARHDSGAERRDGGAVAAGARRRCGSWRLHAAASPDGCAWRLPLLQVRTLRCPLDSQVYVGFVNTVSRGGRDRQDSKQLGR